jgi:cobalt-zinc-cadmium efflux system outer membrane protein
MPNKRIRKMKVKITLILVILMTMSSGLLFTQEKQGKADIVLPDLIKEALKNNPQVKAAHEDWQASLEQISQAKAYPEPMLSFAHFGKSIETRLGPQRNKISLSQKIPFFGKLSIKENIARENSSIFEVQHAKVAADLILQVKEAFFSLYWFEKAIDIRSEEKEVMGRLAKIARKKYETGIANQQDVLKAHLEISRLSEKILMLKQGKKAIEAKLNALLNRPMASTFGRVGNVGDPHLTLSLSELYELAKDGRPELKQAQHFIVKNEKSIELAKKNNWPDFTLKFEYFDIGAGATTFPEDGHNAWLGAIGFNIPLWRGKYKAAEAEATIRLTASQKRFEDIRNDTAARVNEYYQEIKTYEDQLALYKHSLIPQAEQTLKASEVGYLSGKVDFLNLLESERMILQIKTGYFKNLSDSRKSLARLERLVGQDLINIHTIPDSKEVTE